MWYIKLEQIYYGTCGRYILGYLSNDLWREVLGNFENKTDCLIFVLRMSSEIGKSVADELFRTLQENPGTANFN